MIFGIFNGNQHDTWHLLYKILSVQIIGIFTWVLIRKRLCNSASLPRWSLNCIYIIELSFLCFFEKIFSTVADLPTFLTLIFINALIYYFIENDLELEEGKGWKKKKKKALDCGRCTIGDNTSIGADDRSTSLIQCLKKRTLEIVCWCVVSVCSIPILQYIIFLFLQPELSYHEHSCIVLNHDSKQEYFWLTFFLEYFFTLLTEMYLLRRNDLPKIPRTTLTSIFRMVSLTMLFFYDFPAIDLFLSPNIPILVIFSCEFSVIKNQLMKHALSSFLGQISVCFLQHSNFSVKEACDVNFNMDNNNKCSEHYNYEQSRYTPDYREYLEADKRYRFQSRSHLNRSQNARPRELSYKTSQQTQKEECINEVNKSKCNRGITSLNEAHRRRENHAGRKYSLYNIPRREDFSDSTLTQKQQERDFLYRRDVHKHRNNECYTTDSEEFGPTAVSDSQLTPPSNSIVYKPCQKSRSQYLQTNPSENLNSSVERITSGQDFEPSRQPLIKDWNDPRAVYSKEANYHSNIPQIETTKEHSNEHNNSYRQDHYTDKNGFRNGNYYSNYTFSPEEKFPTVQPNRNMNMHRNFHGVPNMEPAQQLRWDNNIDYPDNYEARRTTSQQEKINDYYNQRNKMYELDNSLAFLPYPDERVTRDYENVDRNPCFQAYPLQGVLSVNSVIEPKQRSGKASPEGIENWYERERNMYCHDHRRKAFEQYRNPTNNEPQTHDRVVGPYFSHEHLVRPSSYSDLRYSSDADSYKHPNHKLEAFDKSHMWENQSVDEKCLAKRYLEYKRKKDRQRKMPEFFNNPFKDPYNPDHRYIVGQTTTDVSPTKSHSGANNQSNTDKSKDHHSSKIHHSSSKDHHSSSKESHGKKDHGKKDHGSKNHHSSKDHHSKKDHSKKDHSEDHSHRDNKKPSDHNSKKKHKAESSRQRVRYAEDFGKEGTIDSSKPDPRNTSSTILTQDQTSVSNQDISPQELCPQEQDCCQPPMCCVTNEENQEVVCQLKHNLSQKYICCCPCECMNCVYY